MKNLMHVFNILSDPAVVGTYEINNGVKIEFNYDRAKYMISTISGTKTAEVLILGKGRGADTIRLICNFTKGINKYNFNIQVVSDNITMNYDAILDTSRSTCRFDLSLITKQGKATAKNTVFGTIKITRVFPEAK